MLSDDAFVVTAARAWNNLLAVIHDANYTLTTLRWRLKTDLFHCVGFFICFNLTMLGAPTLFYAWHHLNHFLHYI